MKGTRLINRFSEKKSHLGKLPFWDQKLHNLITLDLLEDFFYNFAQSKRLIGR